MVLVKLYFVSFSEEGNFNQLRENLIYILGQSLVLFNNTHSYTPNVGAIFSVCLFVF